MRVLLDVDDVVCDFRGRAWSVAKELFSRDLPEPSEHGVWDVAASMALTKEETAELWEVLGMPGMAQCLEPLPGALEAVPKLEALAEVVFVTAPFDESPTWVFDRTCWLRKLFGRTVAERTVFTHNKKAVCGRVLVDDKVEHLVQWSYQMNMWGVPNLPLCWSTSYNQEGYPGQQVASWEEVIEQVKRVC